jgi:hypothetical protein
MSTALMRMPEVRVALGVKSNQTARAWCARWNIPIVEINSRAKAVRVADLERSLMAAAGKELANAD